MLVFLVFRWSHGVRATKTKALYVAVGQGAARGAGHRSAGQRIPVRGRRRLLPQNGAARAGGVGRGIGGGDGGADRAGVGGGGAGRDSTAAGGFAEVSGVFAGGHLSAGRDGELDAGGTGGGAAADGAVRGAAAEAREARGARADDAAQRVPAPVFEHAGRAGGEVGRSAAGAREGEAGAGSADRGDLPGEPDGERAAFDAGGAGAVRGGSSDLLLFDGRVVLRYHDGFEREERVSAAQPVPAGGGGLFRAGGGAAAGGGEDSQSAHAAATEPRGAEGGHPGGIEGDGGARGAGGFAGGAAGHRGERGAAVFRGLRRDDQAG